MYYFTKCFTFATLCVSMQLIIAVIVGGFCYSFCNMLIFLTGLGLGTNSSGRRDSFDRSTSAFSPSLDYGRGKWPQSYGALGKFLFDTHMHTHFKRMITCSCNNIICML